MKKYLIFFFLLVFVSSASAQIKVVGHRGCRFNTPQQPETELYENTLKALEYSQRIGVDAVEFDVQLTSDGEVVVFHGPVVPGIGKKIHDITFKEARQLRLPGGHIIPTLEEYLTQALKYPGIQMVVEIKSQADENRNALLVKKVMDTAESMKMGRQLEYTSFSEFVCAEIHRRDKGAKVIFLQSGVHVNTPEYCASKGYDGISYNLDGFMAHPDYVRRSRELGLETTLWLANDWQIINWAILNGIDCISTDHPEKARAYVDAVEAYQNQAPIRGFMSHRGVHLRSTIAGENSLQAIDLARRAGFWCIETDVRYTKDSVLVIMHDKDINRTCTDVSGKELTVRTPVAGLTFKELRENYRLKASRARDRVPVPTLREYLQHCRACGFPVFIEPKLKDSTGRFYLDIIKEADGILGRGGYVITSNNFANDIIRNKLGIKNVRLMGLLYQTDWDTMSSLGNMIFAVSTTGFCREDYSLYVRKAHDAGYWVQSAAGLLSKDAQTDFECFNRISGEGERINLIATDEAAPDLHGQGRIVADYSSDDPKSAGKVLNKIAPMEFSGLYLEISCQGQADIVIGQKQVGAVTGQDRPDAVKDLERVRIGSSDGAAFSASYRKMFFDCVPALSFENASADFKLQDCRIRLVEFCGVNKY